MKVPYFPILAVTFFRFLISARAMPSGAPLGLGAREDSPAGTTVGAALNIPKGLQQKSLPARGFPVTVPGVNVMQNSDESRPPVAVENYKNDVARLTGGEQ